MDPFTILSAIGALAPSVLRWLHHPDAADVADKAAKGLQAITGQDDLQAGIAALKANPEQLVKFQQSMDSLAIAKLDAETKQLQAINATMQAEATSGDPYVRRARPTWLYTMAVTWAVQMGAFSYAIVVNPDKAVALVSAASALTGMWAIALSVVGVYVKSRSDDKKVAAGQEAPSMVAALANLFAKKKAA